MGFLSRLLGRAGAPAPPGDPLGDSASRFREWLSHQLGRTVPPAIEGWGALDSLLDSGPGSPPPEAMIQDAAAWLGEGARASVGGSWREDPVLGPVVANLGGAARLRLRPEDAIRKKCALRGGFSLAAFGERLPARIEAERQIPDHNLPALEEIASLCHADPGDAADRCARALSEDWKRRFGAELRANLRSVRELDRWLRTHYLVCRASEAEWICAGLLVGEVARGLFGGTWVPGADPIRATLRFPELDYQPVGRIYKMMTELPEGEPLEDYVRILPSARRELGSRGGPGAGSGP